MFLPWMLLIGIVTALGYEAAAGDMEVAFFMCDLASDPCQQCFEALIRR